jgi:cellulose 1,4-beta-cellobiosidase
LRGSATISGGALNTTAVAGSLSGGVPQNGVQLPSGAVSGITGPFTIESWFVANYGGGYTTLFSFSGNTTASYVLATPARGNAPYASSISVIGGGGTTSELQASEQYQDNGVLHQLVVTYDGTTLSYYIDGALGSFSGLPPTVTDPGLVLATLTYIGINGGSPWGDNSINGSTRDFRIYGQSLTAGQVAGLYTLGSDASNATIAAALTPPAAPVGLAATPGNNQVGLSWNASSGATSYKVKRSTTNGGSYTTMTNVAATTSTDVGLSNGTTYYYVVSAVNISGESTNSLQVSATPSSTAPVDVSIAASGGMLRLSWPADHTGWRLQVQTNNLATGLGTNWFDVLGSATTNGMTSPMDLISGSVFYRLVY